MDYGMRKDGTPKGIGYFGEVRRGNRDPSTELSIGVDFDGRQQLIPSMVPTLSRQEIGHMASGGEMTDPIVDKAVAHARDRHSIGKSAFAGDNEPNTVNMPMLRQGIQARLLRGQR